MSFQRQWPAFGRQFTGLSSDDTRLKADPGLAVTYFQPDKKKAGGAYVCATGQLNKIDDYAGVLVLIGDRRILIEDIVDIRSI